MKGGAGKLRDLVNIEARSATQSGTGSMNNTWAAITNGTNIWAAVAPFNNRPQEADMSGSFIADVVYEVTIRYRQDVTAAMRLNWQGKLLYIKGVLPNPDRSSVVLMCTLGALEG
jgi:SPP1 family predicted phage head-tail adaptor